MMMNLFSIFDPSTSMYFSLNWISIMYFMLFMPSSYWIIKNRNEKLLMMLMSTLYLELKTILNNKSIYNLIFFISMILLLLFNNFCGLFPYIFTSSSHMVFSLSFSLIIWLMIMLYGWIMNTDNMFCHMLPLGTPKMLMVFMILIETISNIIRPLTLAIRLSANMIAGHLLLTLIGETGEKNSFFMLIIILMIQVLLFMLEMSVCLIQAYVFTILSSLYLSEIN